MVRQRKRGIKGAGSVYKRKSDGRWTGSFKLEGMDKRKYVYAEVSNNTEKAAYELLQQAIKEQKQGILATGPNQKLADHLEWWLEHVHKHKVRIGTYQTYRNILDVHILPGLGSIQLRKLTTRHIQTFYNKKIEAKLSLSRVHSIHAVLHNALKSAVKSRVIPFNPADAVELPTMETQREGQSLTLEQAKVLLNKARGHRLEVFIPLAITTGMRLGEILALRWSDIDFEAETIFVHRSVRYHGSKGNFTHIEGPPKTKSSIRTVPLLPMLSEILESYRAQQNAARQKSGDSWQEKNLVCCTRDGGFLYPPYMRVTFYALLKSAELPHIPIHDLRHTAATLWKSIGIDEKVRQEWMGHSSSEMTDRVYTHVLPSMQKDAVEKANTLFQKPEVDE